MVNKARRLYNRLLTTFIFTAVLMTTVQNHKVGYGLQNAHLDHSQNGLYFINIREIALEKRQWSNIFIFDLAEILENSNLTNQNMALCNDNKPSDRARNLQEYIELNDKVARYQHCLVLNQTKIFMDQLAIDLSRRQKYLVNYIQMRVPLYKRSEIKRNTRESEIQAVVNGLFDTYVNYKDLKHTQKLVNHIDHIQGNIETLSENQVMIHEEFRSHMVSINKKVENLYLGMMQNL